MFNFKNIFQDLIAKILAYGGSALSATGAATGAETQAIVGGIAAAIGVIWSVVTKQKIAKQVAIVAEAVDTQKTTAEVIASPTPVIPVGEAVAAKKNYHPSSSR